MDPAAFPAITCDQVQELLGRYWTSELDSVRDRLVRGHVLECVACQEAYEKVIEAATASPVGARVSVLMELKDQGVEWARQALGMLQELLKTPTPMQQVFQTSGSTSKRDVLRIEAQVLDEQLRPTGAIIPLQCANGPLVDPEGYFRVTLSATREDVSGSSVVYCSVQQPGGELFTFEADFGAAKDTRLEAVICSPVMGKAPNGLPISLRGLTFAVGPKALSPPERTT